MAWLLIFAVLSLMALAAIAVLIRGFAEWRQERRREKTLRARYGESMMDRAWVQGHSRRKV